MEQSLRHTNPILHYGILTFIYLVGAITLLSHTVLHALGGAHHEHQHSHAVTAADCPAEPAHRYTVTFSSAHVEPALLTTERCDEVVVKNALGEKLIPAIGPHDHHLDYPGFEETMLAPGETYAFRTAKTGTFPLHDHSDATLSATIIVK